MNRMLHSIIGVNLLFIIIFLYIGLRPIFVLASLALGIFFIDYLIFPFIYLYKAFIQWLPILFELNILNGILILNRIFHFSKFWSIIFLSISIIRSIIVIYRYHLPIQEHHRLYIENQIEILSKFILKQSKNFYNHLLKLFNHNDDNDLDKFQLEQINSIENIVNEHDETIQRFEKIADELSSPIISNIDYSTSSIRRHHQRTLQQSELEPLSQTPITPAHTNLSKGKILHSTINGSYTGPMTRNRTRTDGKTSITTSPLTNKVHTDVTFIISKRDDDSQSQRFK
ncbi:unnamed protein product [Rotaria sordida]|uniref:Uncharacterized protein n=1 Tax=Rotaria sordida TaxID=392033 RepID=A0A815UPR9_9BILA|nr:unnamed protein product [Rotaria sordida]CAF1000639.1 unnamed protein product [Rotaria sordida]CAF1373006.1 unnamed protein product [Rotaria sordida]CAF1516766.1 unnamed protein product [Rotaria sordida]CAF3725549.1 unnamed protein product [Rotaria sordida]